MPGYSIDRERLEALSSEEILRILKEERDDYTPEALHIFEDILKSRGVAPRREGMGRQASFTATDIASDRASSDLLIQSPRDGVVLLNKLLKGLLDGTMEPQVVQIGALVISNILRAMEQDFLSGSEEE
ncbi:MAG: hypothetical protein ACP5M0_12845 [Desulfomonilaceae bacterium]